MNGLHIEAAGLIDGFRALSKSNARCEYGTTVEGETLCTDAGLTSQPLDFQRYIDAHGYHLLSACKSAALGFSIQVSCLSLICCLSLLYYLTSCCCKASLQFRHQPRQHICASADFPLKGIMCCLMRLINAAL